MEPTAVLPATETMRSLLDDYFAAWGGADESQVLAFFAEGMLLRVPMGTLEGITAIRDNFVRPVLAAFPSNRHSIRSLVHDMNRVAVEWDLEAVHTGPFAGVEASGKTARVPGCSVYEYDLNTKQFVSGAIYFDVGTLIQQISG